ncbi:MAG TPA: hypothetical protein VJM32_01995 [Candidatus Saccharimonadales bacterium]|nr:hypothetical protein [Candidatus Saccharimonadales bacterium]
MTKKLLIPLVILGVVLATGLGIYIASSQSAQPSATQTDTAAKTDLTVQEIGRTITPPANLGKLNYTMNGPVSVLLFSDNYEKLNGCAGKHLGELQLAGTTGSDAARPEGSIAIDSTQYQYGTFIAQPMGECGGDEGKILAESLAQAIANSRR